MGKKMKVFLTLVAIAGVIDGVMNIAGGKMFGGVLECIFGVLLFLYCKRKPTAPANQTPPASRSKTSSSDKRRLSEEQQRIERNEGCEFSTVIPNYSRYGVPITYKYEDVHVKITGDVSALRPGSVVYLQSSGTVANVLNQTVGMIENKKIRDMIGDYYDRGDIITARVLSIDDLIHLNIGFYRDFGMEDYLRQGKAHEVYELTGNRKSSVQESIESCDVGDEISIEYDDDKEKYYAECSGDFIGFFPKSANSKLDDANKAYIYELETEEDDDFNEKHIVSVVVFFE